MPEATCRSLVSKYFRTKELAQVTLIPDQPNLLNVELALGSARETITVSGSAAAASSFPETQGPGGSGTQKAGIFQTENGPQIQARGG